MKGKLDKEAGLILMALVGWVLWFGTGCKPHQDTEGRAAQAPVHTNTGGFAGMAIESDPAKRPLVLSRPAPNARTWVVQALQQGYRDTARTNAAWDRGAQAAFEAFADYNEVSSTNWPRLKAALAALQSSPCDDPMVQYMRARYREGLQSQAETAAGFARIHGAMVRSQYHPLFKFVAGMRAVESARDADSKSDRNAAVERTTVDLQDAARDTNAPVAEVFEAAASWLQHNSSKAWTDWVTRRVEGLLQRGWGDTAQWCRFEGIAELQRAWGERGHGWAATVTDTAWEGFREHMENADRFLSKAWEMKSDDAWTAYLMMRVELGQGRGRERMELWFDRAMSLNPAYYDAAKLMSSYLEPRWYGSETETLEFARSCVASDKWRGQVPLVLVELHRSLARYAQLGNSPVYWHRPEVWQDIKNAYDKFFALNADSAGWRHDYAKDAYDCGQYAVFLEQTKLFAYGTNYAFFGGQEKFQEMLRTATAAASSGAARPGR
jgi:hypothetical protein